MQVRQVVIDFAFPYVEGDTPEHLRLRLTRLAEYWPGWHQFPWRVTRNLHHWLRREVVNFSYLMIQRCVMSYAAHLVLTAPLQDREAVLRVMIKIRFEVGGLMRDLLLEAVRGEMLRTLPDPDAVRGGGGGDRERGEAGVASDRGGSAGGAGGDAVAGIR